MSSRLTVVIIATYTNAESLYSTPETNICQLYLKKKKKNIEIIKREATHLGQEILNKINSWFLTVVVF